MGSMLGSWLDYNQMKKDLMSMKTVLIGIFSFCIIGIITVIGIVIYLICVLVNWLFELFDFGSINNLLS